ncbi:MAG: alpha/beta fold hydrolase [Janthinobacterium lividum]
MRVQTLKTANLKLAYEETGPKDGKPVFLVHGWPDSPRTFDKILPALHAAGYRTIAPYLRGYGPSEFRSHLFGRKPRHTGQPVALAQDLLDLADALKISNFDLVGHDWGARASYALAALAPQRLQHLVAISVPFAPGPAQPPAHAQAQAFWYQWYLGTSTGEKVFRADPVAFCRRQWDTWGPEGWYTRSEFSDAAQSWTGKSFADVVLNYYRTNWGHTERDPNYAVLQARYFSTPSLSVPTLLLHGLEDRCTLPETTDGAGRYFTNGYKRVLLDGVGHFPQRENPDATAREVLQHLQGSSS